jgi:hypothetical protein
MTQSVRGRIKAPLLAEMSFMPARLSVLHQLSVRVQSLKELLHLFPIDNLVGGMTCDNLKFVVQRQVRDLDHRAIDNLTHNLDAL